MGPAVAARRSARGGRARAGRAQRRAVNGRASAGVALERVPRAQREAAEAVARARAALGASAQTTSTGSPEATRSASVPARPRPRRSDAGRCAAARAGRRRPPSGRLELGERGGEVVRRARRAAPPAPARTAARERRTSRGSTMPVPGVALERERRVGRARPARRAGGPQPKATARARAPPPLHGEAHVLALPHRDADRRSSAAGNSSATSGLPIAERRQARRAPRRGRAPARRRATTASTRSTGTSSSGGQRRRGVRLEGGAEGVEAARARTSSPAAARWPPWRARCAGAGVEAGRGGRRRGSSARSPCPRSPSRATSTAGRWWRSAIREATIPITPGCQSLAGEHVGRPLAGARRPAPRRRTGSASRRRGARRWPRRARAAMASARSSSSVSTSSRPASARRRRPAALIRGARRKPDGAGVERGRVDLRDPHQRAQAGLGRGGQRAQPARAPDAGSRRAAARSRRPWPGRRGRGPRRPRLAAAGGLQSAAASL